MTWDDYYEKFYDWATSTQIKHLSSLTSFGSSDEITEVAEALCDEKAANRLIKKALDAGVKFNPSNLEDLNCCVSDEVLAQVAKSIQGTFTSEQLQNISGCIDDDVMETILKNNAGTSYSPALIMELLDTTDTDIVQDMALKVVEPFSSEQLSDLRDYLDDAVLEPLVKKALDAGVRFPPQEIIEWANFGLPDTTIEQMALTVNGEFTAEQAEEIYYILPSEKYQKVARKLKLELHEEDYAEEPQAPKIGFFTGLLLGLGAASLIGKKKPHKHNGHCDGDCANCPPHYGYRYGRWCYGHHHTHGCEFGGNKGGGID